MFLYISYFLDFAQEQNRHHGHSQHQLIPSTKSSRRNKYNNKARRVNQKNSRRGKQNNNSSSSKNQKKVGINIPKHPSLDGFELHNDRNGKSVSSDHISMETSTSEVISVQTGMFKNKPENKTINEISKKNPTDKNVM